MATSPSTDRTQGGWGTCKARWDGSWERELPTTNLLHVSAAAASGLDGILQEQQQQRRDNNKITLSRVVMASTEPALVVILFRKLHD